MSSLKEVLDRKKLIENFIRSTNVMKTVTLVQLNKYKNGIKIADEICKILTKYIFEQAINEKVGLKVLNLILGCDEGMCPSFFSTMKNYLKVYLRKSDEHIFFLGSRFFNIIDNAPNVTSRKINLSRGEIYDLGDEISDYIEKHNITTFTIHYLNKSKIIKQKVIIYRNIDQKVDFHKRLYIYNMIDFAIKRSRYSENTERLLALENANTNSQDMLKKLKLSFNRLRQEKITNSLNEIITGVFI